LTVFLPLFRLESGSNGYSGWVAASEGAGGGGNMKAKHFKVFAVVLLVTVVAAIAVSQTVRRAHMRSDAMFGEGFGGPMMGFLAHKLDLTDAQQAQVKEIMAKERPSFQPLMLQMAQNRKQMRQLIMSTGFDEGKARELATQQTQTVTELTVQRARVESELFQILTPDQKTKLTAIVNQHEQRFMNHMQGQTPAQTQGQGQTQSQ
jgi:Spy/CpxP family protein refolding chaperone